MLATFFECSLKYLLLFRKVRMPQEKLLTYSHWNDYSSFHAKTCVIIQNDQRASRAVVHLLSTIERLNTKTTEVDAEAG